MTNLNPAAHYQEQVINTATPGMITVMLFEEAARSISVAMKAISSNNIQESHNAIVKAENIYMALDGFLNKQFEISKNLSKMYEYISRRLVEANSKKDVGILKEALEFTVDFRNTWKQAEKNANIELNQKSVGRK